MKKDFFEAKTTQQLSSQDLKELFLRVGFSLEIANLFTENNIEGSVLFSLRDANLTRFGLKSLSHRKRVLFLCKRLIEKGSASWLLEAFEHTLSYTIEKKVALRSRAAGAFATWFTERTISFQDATFTHLANWTVNQVQKRILDNPQHELLKPLLPLKLTGLVVGCLNEDDVVGVILPEASLSAQAALVKGLQTLKSFVQRKTKQSRFALSASSAEVSLVTPSQASGEQDFFIEQFIQGYSPSRSCREEVVSIIEFYSWKGYDDILKEVNQRTLDIQKESNPFDLSFEEIFAIVTFTVENDADSLYLNLNNYLRTKDRSQLEVWKGYLTYFLQALSKIPDTKMQVYRGIRTGDAAIAETIEQNYSAGRNIKWYGFSSTSTDYSVAFNFVREQGYVFEINVLSGKDIRSYSLYSEGEILLLPNRPMVVSYDPRPYSEDVDFVRLITLTQIDSQQSFNF